MFNKNDFKEYRSKIGFSNANELKNFLSAKDIKSEIDYSYINHLTQRLKDIIISINKIIDNSIKVIDFDKFCKDNIDTVLSTLKLSNLLPKFNNQGRRPEEVYFSWMRGSVVSHYFTKALGTIFGIKESEISIIGKDNLENIDTFSRQPTADLELKVDDKIIRIEMQSGYQGINDIKQHKVLEAKRQFINSGIYSVVIHFDFFNGQVAFVNISQIKEDDMNWITRQQMEGQTVFNINQDYFVWLLTDKCPKLEDLKECLFE